MNWKLFCLAGTAMLAGCADMGGLTAQLAAQQAGMAPPDRRSAQEG